MIALNADDTFHYEMKRVLGSAAYQGADISELLDIAEHIRPGDMESWHAAFIPLAENVRARAQTAVKESRDISARNLMFKASSYFRAADFFLHDQPDDPRIDECWAGQTECFDAAISRLKPAGRRATVQADDFDIPIIIYQAADDNLSRPTILMCNGYDGAQEEMLHVAGLAALERGMNVITFEGPGQPSVVRYQQKGFITDWERVVTPVVDYCEGLDWLDAKRIGLLGYSLGGELVARAAAFEHRLAGTICIDGVLDVYETFSSGLSPEMSEAWEAQDRSAFDRLIHEAMSESTQLRWAIEQGLWSFMLNSPFDLQNAVQTMHVRDVAHQVECPVLVCDASEDRFFQGQATQLHDALGDRSTLHCFTGEDSAGEHCHVGASVLMNTVVLDWAMETL